MDETKNDGTDSEVENKNGLEIKKTTGNHHRKDLSFEERNAILQALLQESKSKGCKSGKLILKRGAIKSIAQRFQVGRNTVGRIWSRGNESIRNGGSYMDVSSRKFRSGRKKKDYSAQMETFDSLPFSKRSTLRSASLATGIPKTTLFAKLKEGSLLRDPTSGVVRSAALTKADTKKMA